MAKGLVIILSGASSVGKGKIRDELMKDQDLKLFYSISMTTRPQRETEIDGVDYYFVSHQVFAEALRDKLLLEYTEFNGYYYGTPKYQVEFLTQMGKNVLIEVEAQGVGPIKLNIPDSLAFFVVPASLDELEKQINLIYKDDQSSIENRMNKAKMDLELAPLFRNTVTNTDTQAAVASIKGLIIEELEARKQDETKQN